MTDNQENEENKEIDEEERPLTPKIEEPKIENEPENNNEEIEDEDKPIEPKVTEPQIHEEVTEIQDKDKIKNVDKENIENENIENENGNLNLNDDKNSDDQKEEEENSDNNNNQILNDVSGESNENKDVNKSESSGHDYSKTKQVTFENVKLLYKNKKNILRNLHNLLEIYKKFWDLCPHTTEGEITKNSFLILFKKIYKIILPIFNYGEIDKFIEGFYSQFSKGKSTLDTQSFNKAVFAFAHRWCVHVNKDEYEDFLLMIYNRITKIKKVYPDGRERFFNPSIKVTLYNQITKEEYVNSTWEDFQNESQLHIKLYETFEEYEEQKNNNNVDNNNNVNNNNVNENSPINRNNTLSNNNALRARPRVIINDRNFYETDKNFLLYNEDVFYFEQDEIDKKEKNTMISRELLDDKELVIFGYPTQFVINKFINEPNIIENINCIEENNYDSFFYITDYQPYEQQKIYLKIINKEKLINFLKENTSFILLRDIFMINNSLSLGNDFVDEELNIINNLRHNIVFDRYIDIYEIKLPDETFIKANLNNLIINSTFRKAFGNIFDKKLKKIGTESELWKESIEKKFEKIYETKFYLIHIKLQNLNLSYSLFESNIEVIKDEIQETQNRLLNEEKEDIKYFDKFKSKNGIKFDNWDSDNDLYDEANKKSPVILVIGPPRIGKTQISMQLAKNLEMEILDPQKFFDKIFQKVAEYEEKMLTWEEENPPEENKEGEEGEEGEEEKKEDEEKKEKEKKKS